MVRAGDVDARRQRDRGGSRVTAHALSCRSPFVMCTEST